MIRVVVYVAIITAALFYVVQSRQSSVSRSPERVYLSPTMLIISDSGTLTVLKRDRQGASGAERFGIAF